MTKVYTPQSALRPSLSFGAKPTPSKTEYQDPDATTRDNFKPSESNQHIEHDLLKTVWEYIRRGQIQEARKACIKAGEPWRADSISGGELYSVSPAFVDPVYDQGQDPVGNKTRSLWKGTCYALSKEATADQYERAIYGALCGDILSVLPVCSSWEDHAWAQYNALVETMIEVRLAQFDRGGRSKALPLPPTRIAAAKDIFSTLANSNSQAVKDASKDLFKSIQTSIILNETDQLLVKMANDAKASSTTGTSLRPHMLRFMAHFVLLLRSRSMTVPQEAGDYFVKTYVDYLISKKLYDLAPLYASFLPVDLQVEICSSYLKTIDGPKKERQKHLIPIQQNELDLHRILKATVNALLDQSRQELENVGDYRANMEGSISAPITDQEKANIRALEWLSFDQAQYEECLHHSNYLTRKYLLQGRLNTALALFKSLPSDVVQHDVHHSSPTSLSISHEHLYYADLFKARLMFEEWKDAMKTKPAKDASRPKILNWELDVKNRVQKAIVEVESLLQSRWLFDCILPGDTMRNQELKRLRQIYISELVMNLHQMFYESRVVVPGYLEKSVDVSNLVASEAAGAPLYKELQDSDRLNEFLDHVRLSSIELIRAGRSPFAY
ncbi:nuclear pore protein 84/107 [Mortierella sp. GBAus27b]|nr:nuclear pore protein 84/107 [Mortierella sp. GBAus27b]